MPHMVIFRSAEGKPGYHQAESLDEAVRFVEHLRNQEGVSETHIFRMQEVPIEFKTYYKVEVGSDEPTAAPAPEVTPAPAPPLAVLPMEDKAAPAVDEQVIVEPMAVSGNGQAANRFGRFNRS